MNPLLFPINDMPSQMISYVEKVKKNKEWGKKCVDVFESIGRRQFTDNMAMKENYDMLNGKFILSNYMDQEDYKNMLSALSAELEIPTTLRHYDIISKVVNNLTEKLAEFPDVFRVEEFYEEDATNEYVRAQSDKMHQSIKADINNEIRQRLLAEGIDINKQGFESEEEAMQFHKEVQDAAAAMTPPQIAKYMKTEWQGQGEIWGQHQLDLGKRRYRRSELERVEFRDMLTVSRCFRHFFLTGDGFTEESWNPLNTFFHTSDSLEWVQDGNYGGRILYFTLGDVIDRYGWKLKAKQIKRLQDIDSKNSESTRDFTGVPYKTYAPFPDWKAYQVISKASGYDPISKLPLATNDMEQALHSNAVVYSNTQLFRVTEVYWRSQKLIGKYVYVDEDTGLLTIDTVDENFVVPEGVTEITGDWYIGKDVNTVYWTYADEIWKGTKIAFDLNDEDAIYLDLEACEFQAKGDYNPFGAKIPICGRIFNNRNAQAMALVDMMKPHQVGHNVCMNQLYQLLEKETGSFMVWDANFFNTLKDWGGEDSYEKVALLAKELGHVFGDTSPVAMKGANSGGQLPKVMNMELTAQMISRSKLADFFENKAMAQVGVFPQATGDTSPSETAEGVKTAVSQTQANVQRYFKDFFEYKERCLSMELDFAQYTQSKKKDVTVMYTKSDASRVFIQMAGTELLLRNMHVYIVDSQELLRQLDLIHNIFLKNNTTGADSLDLIEIITSNSPSAIKAKLEEMKDKTAAMQQQQQQAELQQQQQVLAQEDKKEDRIDARLHEQNETKKEVAYIATFKTTAPPATSASAGPSPLETQKVSNKQNADQQNSDLKRKQIDMQNVKNNTDRLLKTRELNLKEQSIKEKAKESRDKVKVAVKNKGKYDVKR